MEIRRGGKQLEYFKENRIIHDYLIKQAKINNVKVINATEVDKTIKKMLSNITESCEIIYLNNTVDELENVINIIIKKQGGSIEYVLYPIEGFKEPLIRKINISEAEECDRFINALKSDETKKQELENLYKLSKYRGNKICAANKEVIERIKEDLDKKGYIYKGNEN